MSEEKLVDLFNKIYDSMNSEQKAEAEKCESAEEFIELAGKAGIPVPDEYFDDVAGGVAVNASTINGAAYNQNTTNAKTINAATINAAAYNAATVNQAYNQTTLNKSTAVKAKTAYADLGAFGTPQMIKASFTSSKATWGTSTGLKL